MRIPVKLLFRIAACVVVSILMLSMGAPSWAAFGAGIIYSELVARNEA